MSLIRPNALMFLKIKSGWTEILWFIGLDTPQINLDKNINDLKIIKVGNYENIR